MEVLYGLSRKWETVEEADRAKAWALPMSLGSHLFISLAPNRASIKSDV
jgi:hypothetical protein